MPALPVPAQEETMSAERAMQFGAAALFVARARAAQHSFAITDENAEVVADIVRRLDGIPLAIELAAPRVRVLSTQQLDQRLDERFKLLTGGVDGASSPPNAVRDDRLELRSVESSRAKDVAPERHLPRR